MSTSLCHINSISSSRRNWNEHEHTLCLTVFQPRRPHPLVFSYCELYSMVQSIATELRKSGVHPQTVCAFVLPVCIEAIVYFLALQWIGAIAVPVDPALDKSLLSAMLTNVSALTVVSPFVNKVDRAFDALFQKVSAVCESGNHVHWMINHSTNKGVYMELCGRRAGLQSACADGAEYFKFEPTDPAFYLPSVNTVAGLAIQFSHGGVSDTNRLFVETYKLTQKHSLMLVMPLHSVHGLMATLATLTSGGSIAIADMNMMDSDFILKYVSTWKLNWLTADAKTLISLFKAACLSQSSDLQTLQFIRSVDGLIDEEIIKQVEPLLGGPVLQSYGTTETCGLVTSNTLNENFIGTVGKPVGKIEVCIFDEHKKSCISEHGVEGLVGVFGGHVNIHLDSANPSFKGMCFAQVKHSGGEKDFFLNGDKGYLKENGCLVVTSQTSRETDSPAKAQILKMREIISATFGKSVDNIEGCIFNEHKRTYISEHAVEGLIGAFGGHANIHLDSAGPAFKGMCFAQVERSDGDKDLFLNGEKKATMHEKQSEEAARDMELKQRLVDEERERQETTKRELLAGEEATADLKRKDEEQLCELVERQRKLEEEEEMGNKEERKLKDEEILNERSMDEAEQQLECETMMSSDSDSTSRTFIVHESGEEASEDDNIDGQSGSDGAAQKRSDAGSKKLTEEGVEEGDKDGLQQTAREMQKDKHVVEVPSFVLNDLLHRVSQLERRQDELVEELRKERAKNATAVLKLAEINRDKKDSGDNTTSVGESKTEAKTSGANLTSPASTHSAPTTSFHTSPMAQSSSLTSRYISGDGTSALFDSSETQVATSKTKGSHTTKKSSATKNNVVSISSLTEGCDKLEDVSGSGLNSSSSGLSKSQSSSERDSIEDRLKTLEEAMHTLLGEILDNTDMEEMMQRIGKIEEKQSKRDLDMDEGRRQEMDKLRNLVDQMEAAQTKQAASLQRCASAISNMQRNQPRETPPSFDVQDLARTVHQAAASAAQSSRDTTAAAGAAREAADAAKSAADAHTALLRRSEDDGTNGLLNKTTTICLERVEKVMEAHPAVEIARAFGRKDRNHGADINVALKLKSGARVSLQWLTLHAESMLPAAFVPKRFYCKPDLLKNEDRASLAANRELQSIATVTGIQPVREVKRPTWVPSFKRWKSKKSIKILDWAQAAAV